MRVTIASYIRCKVLLANLKEHFKAELDKAGLFDKDSDYNGMIGKSLMELCKTFSNQGHSGFSANWVLSLFDTLGHYKTLTPISDDPKEWMGVSEMGGKGSPKMWQSRRNPALFSENGGKTYYDVDDKKRKKNKSVNYKKQKEEKAS